jgi:CBS domain-containing protein
MESRSIHSLPVVVEEGFVGVIDYLAILKLYNHQKRVASVTWLDFLNKSLDALGFEDSCLTHTPSIETTLKEALDQLGKHSVFEFPLCSFIFPALIIIYTFVINWFIRKSNTLQIIFVRSCNR